jgi:hypothetical protein
MARASFVADAPYNEQCVQTNVYRLKVRKPNDANRAADLSPSPGG